MLDRPRLGFIAAIRKAGNRLNSFTHQFRPSVSPSASLSHILDHSLQETIVFWRVSLSVGLYSAESDIPNMRFIAGNLFRVAARFFVFNQLCQWLSYYLLRSAVCGFFAQKAIQKGVGQLQDSAQSDKPNDHLASLRLHQLLRNLKALKLRGC